MAQVTIYLPPEVEAKTRREAKKAKKSLSAYIASVLSPPAKANWIDQFYGSNPGFEVPDDSDLLPLDDPFKDR